MIIPSIQLERGPVIEAVTIDPGSTGGVIFDPSGVHYSIRVAEEDFGPTATLDVELVGGARVRFAMGEGPFDDHQPLGPYPRRSNPSVLRFTWTPERGATPTIAEVPCGVSDLDGPLAVIPLSRPTLHQPSDPD